MRKIQHGKVIDEPVKIGETVELVGFYTDPIIAKAVPAHSYCTGCALREAKSTCNIYIHQDGVTQSMYACCIKHPRLSTAKDPVEFCIYKQQGAALEEL